MRAVSTGGAGAGRRAEEEEEEWNDNAIQMWFIYFWCEADKAHLHNSDLAIEYRSSGCCSVILVGLGMAGAEAMQTRAGMIERRWMGEKDEFQFQEIN